MTISIVDSMSAPNWRAVIEFPSSPWPMRDGPFEVVVLDGPCKGMTASAQLDVHQLVGVRPFSW